MNYTIDDIAKELGMSKTTVSRAISGKGRISEATRQRVNDFIKKIQYTPSAVARSLAASKTFNIGLVFPHDSTLDEMPYFQNVLAGACETAIGQNYDILVILADNNDISALQRAVLNKKLDGVIVSRCIKGSKVISYLKENDLSFVVLGNPLDEDVSYVDNDNRGAAIKMIKSLASQNIHKFALIGGNADLYVTQSRLEGYIEGHNSSNISVNEDLIFLNMHKGEQLGNVISSILEKDVECIVCMDDVLCNNTSIYLQNSGINVPNDVKLVSFYDSMLLSSHKPSITALSFDSRRLGAFGVENLLHKINDGVSQNVILSDYDILMRESTGK